MQPGGDALEEGGQKDVFEEVEGESYEGAPEEKQGAAKR